ncbi:sterol O-acyltransferase 1 [Caerostris darwini]|uniref:O-acyltransferase n=1 Tax=Caerostris darwini TaxID=1538125 RepID=A0AAV4PAR8_9ARAC|nr:sterol O-acyltransferase 1 [Caerostris darwini]
MAPHASSEETDKTSKEINKNTDTAHWKQNASKKSSLPTKVFVHRNSVLTDLMEVNHLQTVYNISVAFVMLLLLNSVMYYIVTPDTFWRDMKLIGWAAANVQLFIKCWISYHVLAFLVLYGFKTWIRVRNKINTKMADFVFLQMFIFASILMFVATSYAMVTNGFRITIHLAIMSEQVRLYMKIYSFVRESVPRVLHYKPSKDGKQEHVLYPTASHYLYYLFAPVLIYRDSYPRKKDIQYKFVATSFFNFFSCIFIIFCGCMRFVVDVFQNTGIVQFTLKEAAMMLAGSMVAGTLMMFVIFYGLLHSWLNAFAELLRFGDRDFYQDWWNSTSFSEYYRKWNAVVHDWLYTYVYMESINAGMSRSIALVIVFFVSSVFHEYILSLSFGFFYPVLGVVYLSVGVPVIFLTKKKTTQLWNTFMWSMLFAGWGFVVFLYSIEWYARANCKGTEDPILDYFIPRSWSKSCHILSYS